MPAKTEKQRKLFGAALACRKGSGTCKAKAGEIAKGDISTKEIKKMATNESVKNSVSNLIKAVFAKNYSEANKHLSNVVNDKIKSRIDKMLAN